MSGFHKSPMGFMVDLENGWTVSVQFGIGNYCNNRSSIGNPFTNIPEFIECPNAEIAAWRTDSRGEGEVNSKTDWYIFEGGEQVKGWQNPNEVLEFMNRIAKLGGGEYISECCDAIPIGELDSGTPFAGTEYYRVGFCSKCKDNAVFINTLGSVKN